MSDFDQPLPPAPSQPAGFGAPPPPFGAPGAPTAPMMPSAPMAPPAGGWAGPPVVGGYPLPGFAVKPQRPPVVVGSVLLILGGALMVVGSFLNWLSVDAPTLTSFGVDLSFNGFGGEGETKDGPVFVFLAVVLVAFGVTMLAAKKVLAVAILSVVVASLALLAAYVDVKDVRDSIDELKTLDNAITATMGPGLWVVLAGAVVGLVGGIATLAVRRKPA